MKQQLLEQLKKQELKDTNLPLKGTAHHLVFGDGSANAQIYFLGEAPGKNEDLQGLPFIGAAGKVLDQLLASVGLDRKDVFITSILHYRPPGNRDPKPAEIAAFQPYVDEQIKIISPKVIVTLGRHSLQKFIPNAVISSYHGKPQTITWQGLKLTILPMYHPAAVLYRRDLMKTIEEDFNIVKKFI
jgi:uracil-DNA glycosylase